MFDQTFIDQTREAQGDEAAERLLAANRTEAHSARVDAIKTGTFGSEFARVASGVKLGHITVPVLPDEASYRAFLDAEEKKLIAFGVADPTKAPEPTPPPSPSPGVKPWSEGQPTGGLQPINPGHEAPEVAVQLGQVAALMEGKDPATGQKFERDRMRNFELIKGMETANLADGGTAQLKDLGRSYQDPNMFTI